MKKTFLAVLSGLVLMSVVAWCIQRDRVKTDKLVLVWVTDDNPTRREQIDTFNSLHPKYKLRLDPANSDISKVIVQSIAGVGPDMFDCHNSFELSCFVRAGIAWDITNELAHAGIDTDKSIWSVTQPFIRHNGRIYGFPANATVQGLWFNKEAFDRQRIPYPEGPWTWEQFLPLAKRLTLRDPNGRVTQYGFFCDTGEWATFVYQWGGRIFSEDGTRCVIDSPQAVAGIQFMMDLIYKHHVSPSPTEQSAMATQGGWGSGIISQFASQKAAMAMGERWWLCTLRTYKGLRLGAVEAPHGKVRVFLGAARSTVINRRGPRRRECLDFIRYISGERFNNLVNNQADALSAVRKYCYTPEFLRNPEHPEEDYNAVWRDAMKFAVCRDSSPFVDDYTVYRIIELQLDLVKNGRKTVAESMIAAARQIREKMQENLAEDPVLRARYEKLANGSREGQ